MAESKRATAADAADENAKQAIHEEVAAFVKERTGKNIGRAGGKTIFDLCVARIFESAVKQKSFRFPAGFGSMHIRELNQGTKPKRLPSGQTTDIPAGRRKLRYVEGNAVKELMGTKKAPREAAAPAGTTAGAPV